jgi:hypothetical protein
MMAGRKERIQLKQTTIQYPKPMLEQQTKQRIAGAPPEQRNKQGQKTHP